jgi:hypothetical protein
MTEPFWAVQRTAIHDTSYFRTTDTTAHLGRGGVRISDSGCSLDFLTFRPRDCDTTTDEIRVNANLPDDDLQPVIADAHCARDEGIAPCDCPMRDFRFRVIFHEEWGLINCRARRLS